MLKVNAIQCPTCKVTIYSRAPHDYHGCDCKDTDETGVTIDGGFDYCHYGWGNKIQRPEPFEIEVDATKEQLYQDWNKCLDKHGWIRK